MAHGARYSCLTVVKLSVCGWERSKYVSSLTIYGSDSQTFLFARHSTLKFLSLAIPSLLVRPN